jgi:hypothetical protein
MFPDRESIANVIFRNSQRALIQDVKMAQAISVAVENEVNQETPWNLLQSYITIRFW